MFDIEVQAHCARTSSADLSDAERIDRIRTLEELKCIAAAEQARLAADLDASRRDEEAGRGVLAERRGRGVAAEVALARRESLHRGQQHLGLAKILRDELPQTRAAFSSGRITEWHATLIARETACLSLHDRQAVDTEIAGSPERLEAMGGGELVAELRKLAYRLDAASYVERRRRAESERRVSLRPAPDVMAQLSALLPVKDGVAVFAALTHAADTLVAEGDPRSRGQLMADTLVERVTGPAQIADGGPPVTINVVVPDTVLTGQSNEACYVEGYGPVPDDLGRELATGAAWLRRLYASPETGALVAMDSRRRLFPGGLGRFLRLRDRTCRMPWCDAAIRHADHAEDADLGGPTSAHNGQGLCEAHNHAKQARGWKARPGPGPRHTIETITPTGHTYTSTAPPAREPRWSETRPGLWTLAS